MKKESPNSFENHFSKVQSYNDGYGYVVNVRNTQEAVDKIFSEWLNYSWLTDDMQQRMKRELRENMRECWVRWQGFQDEDDYKLRNCWVITSEWMGGKPRWKRVLESNYNKHYVEYGHRFEPKADEPGNRVHYNYDRCDICNQIDILKQQIKDASGHGQHACYCPRSVDNGCECALKDI